MIAPSYWVDPKSGNNYFLTVQYTNHQLGSMTMEDFKQIPLHAKDNDNTTMLENVADIKMINTPTEVDHYQLFRKIDVYVAPKGEDLGASVEPGAEDHQGHQAAAERSHRGARVGEGDAPVVPQLRPGTAAGHRAGVPDPDGAVRVVRRSLHHSAGDSVRHHRRDSLPAGDGHHAERDVADGSDDDDRHRGLQQHSDRGRDAHVPARAACRFAMRSHWLAGCGCGRS